jgi:hypothetical protein
MINCDEFGGFKIAGVFGRFGAWLIRPGQLDLVQDKLVKILKTGNFLPQKKIPHFFAKNLTPLFTTPEV